MRIAIVAGEVSGDILGAGLIAALRKRYPSAVFEGIAGPLMQAQGCTAWYPIEKLSVMALTEVLAKLREILAIRKDVRQRWLANPPDLFIGIDAPDFNLRLESQLKSAGIPTIHYVSPSVWAWRQGRIRKIVKAVDHMLTLFPFEADFYRQHQQAVTCVGHPLADDIPLIPDLQQARIDLDLPADKTIIGLLPGSRASEVSRLIDILMATAAWVNERQSNLHFVIPAANAALANVIRPAMARYPSVSVQLIDGQSRTVMQASDAILLASGTATLEAMLMKRPMVVTYRVSGLSYAIMNRLVKTPFVALPNVLANEMLVPELIQHDAVPEKLGPALLEQLAPGQQQHLNERFTQLHKMLRLNASESAADVVEQLLESR